jgi:small subunit ribosomal protein S4
MKRKHKKYSRPKRPFDKARIDEEVQIKKEFGLKNKKEIWKADAKIKSMREKAKKLISAPEEEQKALFDRLKRIGLEVNSIGEVLSLDKKDYLKRRLQTVLVKKELATTPKSARQLIVHQKVLVDNKILDSPSYIVPVALEDKISLKPSKQKKIKENLSEEKTEVVKEEKD